MTIDEQMRSRSKKIWLFLLLSGLVFISRGQNSGDSLYRVVAHLDSVVFNAFNDRDTETFRSMFAEDLEFFHDQGGLTGYEHTMNFMKEVAANNNGLRRDLVKGSLEVYPIPGYGAMEVGSHVFCHKEDNKDNCGTFKFVHIWQFENETWKISKVVSYGH